MLSAELKAFYMVARLGSITQAAKKLGLSQPTVTTQIRSLEGQYAVELFYRGGRRLTLTDEGARLLPMVQALLQQESDIEFFLRNCGQMQGSLRIGATSPYYVLGLIKAFRERYPQIEVSVEIGNSQQVLEALYECRVDLAASSQPVEDARLIHLVLGRDPLVLAVHRSHPLAAQRSVALGELRNHCLLMREAGSTTRELTEKLLRESAVTPASMLEIGSRESIREAVIRNLGVSIISRQEVPDNPELRVLELQGAPLIDEYLFCLKERRQARLTSAFLALARETAPAP
ncbi:MULTISPECIES: LysR substrate-binding domain-containing protein [Pseudomonas]|jgi:aminoethylphosphonate catabolism LysR family transcriptional regulator|uniref:LysR substrate-binding domain-containing protein n=1 Tax=Pseudomonas citronellolis TaxID=53408 RepID=A0AAW6P5Z0_9PSED|nr:MULTISPECIES: LysR substrate-binding domain-containing protein [Pseudomonas]AMO75056.1 HTH-type transcriptional activator CmpR [Pseudomonas citronellolis]KES25789.1 LysR family transcriptional regulator [Pseudomonas sp. AAC]MBH3433598.1 LysR family transcriptional regulator [Pseudomonas citronellolis]MCP1642819.1 aminoethylphosphonate catabolism LysR family transcriptional regulator [Pseudomonas citronellolis]MCP1665743.1 aminoethylphosphonate catabolism LysR family transcriptional regulato